MGVKRKIYWKQGFSNLAFFFLVYLFPFVCLAVSNVPNLGFVLYGIILWGVGILSLIFGNLVWDMFTNKDWK